MTRGDELYRKTVESLYPVIGPTPEAAKSALQQVLKLEPAHTGAHLDLGAIHLAAGEVETAARHYHLAVMHGFKSVETEGRHIPWHFLHNQQYLSALAGVMQVREKRSDWQGAVEIAEKLLCLNPNDNQGIRYSIGTLYLLSNNLPAARAAYSKCRHEEPGCAFNLALARLLGPRPRIRDWVEPMLEGMYSNQYMAPLLLGVVKNENAGDSTGFSSKRDIEWAEDVTHLTRALWDEFQGPLSRTFYNADVLCWLRKLTRVRERLDDRTISFEDRLGILETERVLRRCIPALAAKVSLAERKWRTSL